jgi:hypothetical protein
MEQVIKYSFYGLTALCVSALVWGSPTQSDESPYSLAVNLFVLSTSVYLPLWGIELFYAAFGVILVLFGAVLLLFRKHRRELVEVTWKNPDEDTPRPPAEPEEFRGRGTV